MSYGHQGPPRRPGGGYGGPPGPGRPPGPPPYQPAYGETRKMDIPGGEPPLLSGRRPEDLPPQDYYGGQPQDDYGPPPDQQGPPPGQGYPPPRRPRRRPRWGRRILIVFLVILLMLGGVWLWLDLSLNRVQAITDYEGRPAAASGTNWLIVGSDSREGLTLEEQQELATGGDTEGSKRTDTILIAHLPDNDTPATLISLPRDSQVDIPGHGSGKINAAFNHGPAVLVQTVEQKTQLRIDHYAEISFGGFAKIVDAIGGVEMDIPEPMHDTFTNVTIDAGHQELNGAQALAFVRMRHSEATPRSDLDRVANQRKFIGALAGEISSPGTFLNPFDVIPLLGAIPDALIVGEEDHLHHLLGLGMAMGGISDGGTLTTTVPVTDGSATEWDSDKSQRLFDAMRNDTAVPEDVIYN